MQPKYTLLFVALVPLTGFTNCEYFANVTVPRPGQDTTAPTVGTRMWIDGKEWLDIGDSVRTSVTGDVVVAPFVYDSGGAGFLRITETVTVSCHNSGANPELSQLSQLEFFPQATSQTGAPGQLRSNGMYLLGVVDDLTSFTSLCLPHFAPVSVRYVWLVAGADLSGNRSGTDGGITWRPPGTASGPVMTERARAELAAELTNDPSLRDSSTTIRPGRPASE